MPNGESPKGSTRVQYSNEKAKKELRMEFRPASEPLNEYKKLIESYSKYFLNMVNHYVKTH